MKLVIGGAFGGKTQYAEQKFGLTPEDWCDGYTCTFNEIFHSKGIKHFHEFVRRSMKSGNDLTNFAEDLMKRNPDIVIVTNELGYGVVPADAFDRRFREADGRICTQLASCADEVDRVVCGIGIVIKEPAETVTE